MNYTCYQGTITSTLAELTECFGAPDTERVDAPKVRAEWEGDLHSVPFTIYDWKQGDALEELTEWNVGGHDHRAVAVVELALERHRALR